MPAANTNGTYTWCRSRSTKITPESDGKGNGCFRYSVNQNENGLQTNISTNSTTTSTSISTSTTMSTSYERAIKALQSNESWSRDITLGKRVGLYRLRGDLGSGNFSKVKIAIHHLTKETVAIKTLDKTKLEAKTRRMLTREISIMHQLCHPNIVKLFEVIETLDKVHLVMECGGGGELCTRITTNGKMTEDKCKWIFAQIISAIYYLHSLNIIHRDIKSENVFLADENIVKVGDFGFSTTVTNKDEHLRTFCGSPPYAAPELFHDESYIGPTVDIWALGVLLFFIVTGQMPFRAHTVVDLKQMIQDGDYRVPSYVSPNCSRLVHGILRTNPRERFSLQQIIESPWLSNETSGVTLNCSEFVSPYKPWPTVSEEKTERSKLELKTRHRMSLLGITDQMIDENSMANNCNNSVIGTFRILMHSLHKAEMELPMTVVVVESRCPSSSTGNVKSEFKSPTLTTTIKNKNKLVIKRSRTCVIL